MPKLKKQPKNGYFFFIMEKKQERESEGYIVGNFQNASQLFGHLWTKMTKDDKLPYEQMAKQAKEEEKHNINNKFTVTGESYAQLNRKKLDQQAQVESMNEFIENLSSGPEAGDRIYVFMKVNYCVEEVIDKTRKVYWPSELSMAAFSLKKGIQAMYTQMVDTVTTPTGYASQAKEYCEETLMPQPGDPRFTESCSNYLAILKNINGFANHWLKDGYDVNGRRIKVFFAREIEAQPILTSLQWMVNQLQDGPSKTKYQNFVRNLKVYSAARLIISMAVNAQKVNPSYSNYLTQYRLESAAESAILLKGNYDYREEIACPFHRTEGSMKMQNCAQSNVMRRIYMIFLEFVPAYKFPSTDRHEIGKLSKRFHGPMLRKSRGDAPQRSTESSAPASEPAWLSVEDNDRISNTSPKSPISPTTDPWGKRSAPAASFEDTDFPSLGRGVDSNISCESGWPRSRQGHSPTTNLEMNTGSGNNQKLPPWCAGSPVRSSESQSETPSDADDIPDWGTTHDESAGRGRGAIGASNYTSDFLDDTEDFPSLQATVGRGRGRGRRP